MTWDPLRARVLAIELDVRELLARLRGPRRTRHRTRGAAARRIGGGQPDPNRPDCTE